MSNPKISGKSKQTEHKEETPFVLERRGDHYVISSGRFKDVVIDPKNEMAIGMLEFGEVVSLDDHMKEVLEKEGISAMYNEKTEFYSNTAPVTDDLVTDREESFFINLKGKELMFTVYRKIVNFEVNISFFSYEDIEDSGDSIGKFIVKASSKVEDGVVSDFFQAKMVGQFYKYEAECFYSILIKIDKRLEYFEKQIKKCINDALGSLEHKECDHSIFNEDNYKDMPRPSSKEVKDELLTANLTKNRKAEIPPHLEKKGEKYVISAGPLKDVIIDIKTHKAIGLLKDGKVTELRKFHKEILKKEGVEY